MTSTPAAGSSWPATSAAGIDLTPIYDSSLVTSGRAEVMNGDSLVVHLGSDPCAPNDFTPCCLSQLCYSVPGNFESLTPYIEASSAFVTAEGNVLRKYLSPDVMAAMNAYTGTQGGNAVSNPGNAVWRLTVAEHIDDFAQNPQISQVDVLDALGLASTVANAGWTLESAIQAVLASPAGPSATTEENVPAQISSTAATSAVPAADSRTAVSSAPSGPGRSHTNVAGDAPHTQTNSEPTRRGHVRQADYAPGYFTRHNGARSPGSSSTAATNNIEPHGG